MTVAELIEKLAAYPRDMPVVVDVGPGLYDPVSLSERMAQPIVTDDGETLYDDRGSKPIKVLVVDPS